MHTKRELREMRLDLSISIQPPLTHTTCFTPYHSLHYVHIQRIYQQAWPKGFRHHWSPKDWQAHLNSAHVRALFDYAGFIEFHLDSGSSIFIELFAVDPFHQRQGHGTRLLSSVISYAKELGLRRVILVTTKDVQSFYTRFGFEFYREVEDGYHT